MKVIVLILMILLAGNCFSQSTSEEKLLLATVLNSKVMAYSRPVILSKLDTSFAEYHLAFLVNSKDNIFHSTQIGVKDSIVLTDREKQRLIEEFRAQYHQKWKEGDVEYYSVIESENMKPYLRERYTNTVIMISKPIFIRDRTIAMAFLANFCCSGNNGFVELFLYKKNLGGWESWIPISQGDF